MKIPEWQILLNPSATVPPRHLSKPACFSAGVARTFSSFLWGKYVAHPNHEHFLHEVHQKFHSKVPFARVRFDISISTCWGPLAHQSRIHFLIRLSVHAFVTLLVLLSELRLLHFLPGTSRRPFENMSRNMSRSRSFDHERKFEEWEQLDVCRQVEHETAPLCEALKHPTD